MQPLSMQNCGPVLREGFPEIKVSPTNSPLSKNKIKMKMFLSFFTASGSYSSTLCLDVPILTFRHKT